MFVAWYLSSNIPGAEKLLPMTLVVVALYFVLTLCYKLGRTKKGFLRALAGGAFADAMTEFGWYLGFMEYFPGYDSLDEPIRLFPAFILCILFFVGAWWLVKVLNNMFA